MRWRLLLALAAVATPLVSAPAASDSVTLIVVIAPGPEGDDIIAWTPVAGASAYTVNVQDGEGNWTLVATVPAPQTWTTVTLAGRPVKVGVMMDDNETIPDLGSKCIEIHPPPAPPPIIDVNDC